MPPTTAAPRGRIDYDVLLADLTQQRTGLEQELADVDAIIDAVRKRAGPKVAIADVTRAAPMKGPRSGAKRKRAGKLTDEQLAKMRAQFERGVNAKEIGKAFGVTDSAVYLRANALGWKRPKRGAAAAAAPVKPPAGEQLPGSVRCPHCSIMTDYDPCRACGKKVRKW